MKRNNFQVCSLIAILSLFGISCQTFNQTTKLQSDDEIRQKIVGTWMATWDSNDVMIFSLNGSFEAPPYFKGTWQVKDGIWISALTNVYSWNTNYPLNIENYNIMRTNINSRTTNYPINHVENYKIIHVDNDEFNYELGSQKMLLKRKNDF